MYNKILVALDHTTADQSLLEHIQALAQIHGSQLLLVHVADGWGARNFQQLDLQESQEMKDDRAYLDITAERLRALDIPCTPLLALGNPPAEILKTAADSGCDLIAMTSHGHRLLADIFLGSTIDYVRHRTHIPMLVVRAAA